MLCIILFAYESHIYNRINNNYAVAFHLWFKSVLPFTVEYTIGKVSYRAAYASHAIVYSNSTEFQLLQYC